MRYATLAALCGILLWCLCLKAQADTKSLIDLPAVTNSELRAGDGKVSVHDQIFDRYLEWWGADTDEHFTVYDLSGRFTQLTGTIGVPDSVSSSDDRETHRYAILVDGKSVVDGTMNVGDGAVPVTLDLTDAKSLRIVLSQNIVFADPTLTLAPKPVPGIPLLTYPKNGDPVSGKTLDLHWSPVSGATSYGVECLCTQVAVGVHTPPALYSFTTPTPSVSVDLSTLAAGAYQWKVVAFGPTKPLGGFSRPWTFTVDR